MPSFTVTAAGQRVNLGISGGAQASFTVTNTRNGFSKTYAAN